MEIKQINTTKDICKLLGIDYDESVITDIDDIICENEEWSDFKKAFTEYYSEHGLGGDDKYNDCLNIFSYLLQDVVIYRVGDIVELQGNSGAIFKGEITKVNLNDTYDIDIITGNNSKQKITSIHKDYILRRLAKASK